MRVAFDCSPLRFPHSPGIARVVEETVAALEARGRMEVVRCAPEPGASLRDWRWREWPRALRLGAQPGRGPMAGVQGVHTFQAAFPLRVPQARVQTLHEASWKHGVRERGALRRRLWCALGARWADAIVTATQHSAGDLGLVPAAEGGKLWVIPWGVGSAFATPPQPGADSQHLAALDLSPQRFVLAPGGSSQKKRPERLLAALARWPKSAGPAPTIVWTGGTPGEAAWQPPASWAVSDPLPTYRWLPRVSDEVLASLYRQAAAVVVLSQSEGFALPVIEALACASPVVVTPHSAQAEVLGEAGWVAESDRPQAILDALLAAIHGDGPSPSARRKRAEAFPWDRTAAAIESLWESLL